MRLRQSFQFQKGVPKMTTTCPHCQSQRIATQDIAKKACGYLGMIGGAVTGTTGFLSGAEIGGTVGLLGGPAVAVVGGIAGAVLGALVGAATGGVAGAKLGESIDEHLLDNYGCLDCGHGFSLPG
jgi:hypothetical protein